MFKPAKAGPQKAITANLLGNGRVVFLDETGGWVQALAEARLAADGPELDAALAIAKAATEARVVVEPYAIDVEIVDDAPVPVRLRERIRAVGPTVDYGADEARRLGAAG
jgi:hypothetical protein